MKSKGFTLLELLVAASIIGLLTSFALSAYLATQRSGRNTQRQSDLRTIQNALEHYNADQGFYPTQPLPAVGIAFTNQFGRVNPQPPSRTYLSAMPKDPLDATAYQYQSLPPTCTNDPALANSNCYSYCLYAKLENQPASLPASCPPVTGYNFALTTP